MLTQQDWDNARKLLEKREWFKVELQESIVSGKVIELFDKYKLILSTVDLL